MDYKYAATLNNNLVREFRCIGQPGETLRLPTAMPQTTRNDEGYMYELFVAKSLASLAKARVEAAEKACIEAGCLRDYDKSPDNPHPAEVIYDGDVMRALLKVSQPSERIDTKMLIMHLKASGVDEAVINNALLHATKIGRGAHTVSVELVID